MDSNPSGDKDGVRSKRSVQQGKRSVEQSKHRHRPEQTQQLVEFFKTCPFPDEYQRYKLSEQTGLDINKIKYWFQNKRNHHRVDISVAANDALRQENENIKKEISALKESLVYTKCVKCNSNLLGESLQKLRKDNTRIKQEVEKITKMLQNMFQNTFEKQIPQEVSLSLLIEKYNSIAIERQYWDLPYTTNQILIPSSYLSNGLDESEKSLMVETAVTAMQELIELCSFGNELYWVENKSLGNNFIEYSSLHEVNYAMRFPKINGLVGSNIIRESSKVSTTVPVAASQLVEMFSDEGKWKDFFWTIVTEAKTIATVESEYFLAPLQMIHAKIQAISPLVAPRDFNMLRCIRQLDSTMWIVTDVSYQILNENGGNSPLTYWKYPSGCIIQMLPNQTSHVTWIEHIQVDNFYTDSIYGFPAYNAVKWITVFQRMCGRHAFLLQLANTPENEIGGVITSYGGRKAVLEFSKRMVMKFCETFCVSEKLDFSVPQTENYNIGLHFYGRNNLLGEPSGAVLCAVASLWLPIPYGRLFSILKDIEIRPQWDCLANGNYLSEITHLSTGHHPGDRVTVLQAYGHNQKEIIILQESYIDSTEGFVVYSPMDLSDMLKVISGDRGAAGIPILPSGFVMSSDGTGSTTTTDHGGLGGGSSSSSSWNSMRSTGSSNGGCFLTVIMQFYDPDKQFIATARTLMDFTVERIKKVAGADLI